MAKKDKGQASKSAPKKAAPEPEETDFPDVVIHEDLVSFLPHIAMAPGEMSRLEDQHIPKEKDDLVRKIREQFRNSSGVLFAEFRGLSDANLKDLRARLRPEAEFEIVKLKLAQIAAGQAGYPDLHLTGPLGMAFVLGDASTVARTLRDYSVKNPSLILRGGFVEGHEVDRAGVDQIANIGTREEVLQKIDWLLTRVLSSPVDAASAPLYRSAALFEMMRRGRSAAD